MGSSTLCSPSTSQASETLIPAPTSTDGNPKRHVVTTQTEHKCVLDSCHHLQQEGFDVTYLPVRSAGLVDLERLASAIRPDTGLVSVMAVNNEICTVPTPLVVGFGKACEVAMKEMEYDGRRIAALQERLLKGIREKLDRVVVNGSIKHRYAGKLNLSFASKGNEKMGILRLD